MALMLNCCLLNGTQTCLNRFTENACRLEAVWSNGKIATWEFKMYVFRLVEYKMNLNIWKNCDLYSKDYTFKCWLQSQLNIFIRIEWNIWFMNRSNTYVLINCLVDLTDILDRSQILKKEFDDFSERWIVWISVSQSF